MPARRRVAHLTAVLAALTLLATATTATAGGPFQRVGAWPCGPTEAVAFDEARDLLFAGSAGAVLVLDASDPRAPASST